MRNWLFKIMNLHIGNHETLSVKIMNLHKGNHETLSVKIMNLHTGNHEDLVDNDHESPYKQS